MGGSGRWSGGRWQRNGATAGCHCVGCANMFDVVDSNQVVLWNCQLNQSSVKVLD
jgi:hypothetical protein